MIPPVLSFEEGLERLAADAPAHGRGFAAMYTSLWDAIVTDPRLMRVPVDDHLVHRGDGVFETVLFEGGRVYNQGAHVERLFGSAERVGLGCPLSRERVEALLPEMFRVAGLPRALGRVLLGRGPGGFSVDPAESVGPSLYVVVYAGGRPFMEAHPEGARVIFSGVAPKSAEMATVKTCNYLPNVLMKAEANAAGAHFALGVDEEGYVTESFTENVAGVEGDGRLVVPPAGRHLPGTTLQRVRALASEAGMEVEERRLRPADLREMSEILIVGTTAYVTSVTDLEGRGYPIGPVGRRLGEALLREIRG